MNRNALLGIVLSSAAIGGAPALAQAPAEPAGPAAANPPIAAPAPASGPAVLEWTPPVFAQLRAQASSRSSFTMDRTMLAAASSLIPGSDAETRQAIDKLDGVSVHILRFNPGGIPDEASVDAIRQAYRLRGWKHLVTNVGPENARNPLQNRTTDLWLAIDGINIRGGVALVETPKSIALIAMSGNLSPVDILHLRGHFGIPKFEGDQFKDARDR
jgi:hypothetical protein